MPYSLSPKDKGTVKLSNVSSIKSQAGGEHCEPLANAPGLPARCLQQPSSGINPWPLKRGCPARCIRWGSLKRLPEGAAPAHMLHLNPKGFVQVSDAGAARSSMRGALPPRSGHPVQGYRRNA